MDRSPDFTWITDRSDVSNREKVRILRDFDPDLGGSELARILGLTRERIRQLLKGLDLETDVRKRLIDQAYRLISCCACGKLYRPSTKDQKYCSRACWIAQTRSWIGSCLYCDKRVVMRESWRRVSIGRGHSNVFCGRVCYSLWRTGKTRSELKSYSNLLKDSL